MLNNEEKKSFYHLSCNYCGKNWMMDKAFPKYCPFCGHSREEKSYLNCNFGQITMKNNKYVFIPKEYTFPF